jgi:group I intron endonuclease
MGTIYVIENKITHRKYVGKTERHFDRRLKQHLERDQYIDRALRKNGLANFGILIEEDIPNDFLDLIEIAMIKSYNSLYPSGYNLTTGGGKTDTMTHNPRRKEIIQKLVESHLGKTYAIGRKFSAEWKAAHSKKMKGRKYPYFATKHAAMIKRLGNARRGKPLSKTHRAHLLQTVGKPVCQYTKDDSFIREWECLSQAGRELGFSVSHISQVCNGKRNSAYGFLWKLKGIACIL